MRNTPQMPQTFAEFWPYYMAAHQNPVCRSLHYVGSTGALAAIGATVATGNPYLLLAGVVWAYGLAWIGHFAFEGNKPASWVRWWWSLMGDWKMYFLWLSGKLGPHVEAGKGAGDIFEVAALER